MMDKFKDRIGTLHTTINGCLFEVIEYNSSTNVTIKFKDDFSYTTTTTWAYIKSGNVKNPFFKSIYGVGYFGDGEYVATNNGKITPEYNTWRGFMRRCYSNNSADRNKYSSYDKCSVCEEWHNFQTFAKWFHSNSNFKDGWHFDKDLLQQNCEYKIYSPSTCVFIPEYLNKFLANKYRTNTTGHTGVIKKGNKWHVRINDFCLNKRVFVGSFYNIDDANSAYNCYRNSILIKLKEKLIDDGLTPDIVKFLDKVVL